MGLDISEVDFGNGSNSRFVERLLQNLSALKQLLAKPGFGETYSGCLAIGAELEMYIIDAEGLPLSINQKIMDEAQDPQLTLELNRYNLEYNLTPYAINQGPLQATEQEISTQLNKLNTLAAAHGGRVIPIGILPTLKADKFGPDFMTDRARYRVLVEQLIQRRGAEFQIDINGPDPLQLAMSDVTLEGANTSFQIHYLVNPEDYVNTYNAIQLVTPLVLALAANSPSLFGHKLWMETRVPLFKQSIDVRIKDHYRWQEPARVNFGLGWASGSALELFQQTVNVYPPLLPICAQQSPLQQLHNQQVPELAELKLHQSSVWLWNRPVYDHLDGGHLRIEMRALPAGPSAVDMVANAALYIGLAEAFKNEMPTLVPALPFQLAEHNFYRAAQYGLDAKLVWPDVRQSGCREYSVVELLKEYLPTARDGLLNIGVSQTEVSKYLSIVEQRLENCQTGASWQLHKTTGYQQQYGKDKSQHMMLEDYIENAYANKPVAQWT